MIPAAEWYAAETERLRSAARWLASALAAVGVVLLAGLQLSNIGTLTGARLGISLAAASMALLVVGWMIRETTQIFTSHWISLADLSADAFLEPVLDQAPTHFWRRWGRGAIRPRPASATELLEELRRQSQSLFRHAAESPEDLHKRLRLANQEALKDSVSDEENNQRVRDLRESAQAMVAFANYYRTRQSFDRLVPKLLAAAAVAGATVTLFAWASNPH